LQGKRGKTFLKKSLSPYPLYKKLSFAKAHPPIYGRCAFGSLKRFVKRCPEQIFQCEFRFCTAKRDSLKKVLEKGDRVRGAQSALFAAAQFRFAHLPLKKTSFFNTSMRIPFLRSKTGFAQKSFGKR